MSKKLVIVESPGKIKKIQEFLGPSYRVAASVGHIREISKDKNGIDKENDYKVNFVISEGKQDVVKGLKKLVKESSVVYLASDADREGESISWHLKDALDIQEEKIKRIVFIEITKKAIEHAIANPITLDMNMVYSQRARAVLDRLVGFDLSPLLWKKVKPKLSGGRVQSVAVKIISDKEKEIKLFSTSSDFKVVSNFDFKGADFKSTLNARFKANLETKKFLEQCMESKYIIENIEKSPGKRSSPAPFTTSTLQQTANTRLGWSIERISKVSNDLYTAGLVTYIRTDSVTISEDAIKGISEQVTKQFGKAYSNPKRYKTKSDSAQLAHEAIRVIYFDKPNEGTTDDEKRLYDLIYKRTMASQMSDAQMEKTTVTIGVSKAKEKFITKGETIKFDGFLKLYSADKSENDSDDDEKGILPNFKVGDEVLSKKIDASQTFKKPPSRYGEASIVKKLEELGIGRPSTYASIISTIQNRGYVEIKDIEAKQIKVESLTLIGKKIEEFSSEENFGGEKKKMVPTDIGILVTDFLTEHFEQIMDYNFTANVENDFDLIAKGEKEWVDVIRAFYTPFKEKVKSVSSNGEKIGIRNLGKDPSTGLEVFARHGRFGPMVQLGEKKEGADNVKFAKIGKDTSVEEITLKQAIELLKWPRVIGIHNKKEVTVSIGKFGPYVKYDGAFTSIGEDKDPLKITLKECVELLEESQKQKSNKVIKEFKSKDIVVLNGKFGAYIKKGTKNYKIPEYEEAGELTLAKCEEIIKNSNSKKKKSSK